MKKRTWEEVLKDAMINDDPEIIIEYHLNQHPWSEESKKTIRKKLEFFLIHVPDGQFNHKAGSYKPTFPAH
jgi:hypothetical protein